MLLGCWCCLQVLPAVVAFTDTARSGVLPPTTAATFPWLEATSAVSDPVYGGMYMSSDYTKYSFPMATSMTLLAWSLLEFSGGYAAGGSLNTAQGQLRWGADYLKRAHTTPSSFVVQVRSHRVWQREKAAVLPASATQHACLIGLQFSYSWDQDTHHLLHVFTVSTMGLPACLPYRLATPVTTCRWTSTHAQAAGASPRACQQTGGAVQALLMHDWKHSMQEYSARR